MGITKKNKMQTKGDMQGMGYPGRGNYFYQSGSPCIRDPSLGRTINDVTFKKLNFWKRDKIVRIELDLFEGSITFIKKAIVMGSLKVDISSRKRSPCEYYSIISVRGLSTSQGDVYRILE